MHVHPPLRVTELTCVAAVQVAVKTVTFQERSSGGGAQARAIAEAAITFSLSHPNVIATYFHEIKPLQFAPDGAAAAAPPATSGRRNGAVSAAVLSDARLQDWKLFLVQEFCEGGSLRNLVDSRGFVNQHGRVKLVCLLPCHTTSCDARQGILICCIRTHINYPQNYGLFIYIIMAVHEVHRNLKHAAAAVRETRERTRRAPSTDLTTHDVLQGQASIRTPL